MEYTIIGSGVNLAARLETAAAPGEILIAYETFAHVKDEVYCEECDLIKVKGISHPVHTYRVIDLHENLKEKHAVRAEMPHFKVDANFKLMSEDERQEAALLLREMLARLSIESVVGPPPVRLAEA
jgi:hypothetical protein